MGTETAPFNEIEDRLSHRSYDHELVFSDPPTRSSHPCYEFSRREIPARLESLRGKLLKFEFIRDLRREFPEAKVYLVGGGVRDAILGSEPKDLDLVIGGIPAGKLGKYLEKYGKLSKVEARQFGVFVLVPEEVPDGVDLKGPIEIALPRSESYGAGGGRRDVETISDPDLSIEEDLARRDFTISAMALDLFSGELIDPFDGESDLEKRILRAVGEPSERFNLEDPSRILRGFRFACTLGLDIDEDTWRAMQRYAGEIWANLEASRRTVQRLQAGGVKKVDYLTADYNEFYQEFLQQIRVEGWKEKHRVAAEMVAKEFLQGFHDDPVRMIRLLRDSDALNYLLPELVETIGVKQPTFALREGKRIPAHKYDVWGHTLKALETLPPNASINLQVATLLHDVAKPQTQELEEGWIHFHGHAQQSAKIAEVICERLRLSSPGKKSPYSVDSSWVAWLVENHMQLFNFDEMRETTREGYLAGEKGLELLELHRADLLASSGDLRTYEYARKWREERLKTKGTTGREEEVLPPLITGYEVMEILKIRPGPRVGEVLREVREAQLAGKINTPQEAVEFVKRL